MATALHDQFDFEFITPKPWPELPIRERVKVLVGIKYIYTDEDIAGLMLGEDLPKKADETPTGIVFIGCIEHTPDPKIGQRIRQEMQKRYNTKLCLLIFMSKNRKWMQLDWTNELDHALYKVA